MAKVKSLKPVDHSNLEPYCDRVVIKPVEEEKKKNSKIETPETAKERPSRGIVIAVGPGKKDEPTQAKVGQNVLYSKYSGTEFENKGETLLVMTEGELFMKY